MVELNRNINFHSNISGSISLCYQDKGFVPVLDTIPNIDIQWEKLLYRKSYV